MNTDVIHGNGIYGGHRPNTTKTTNTTDTTETDKAIPLNRTHEAVFLGNPLEYSLMQFNMKHNG